MTSSTIASLLPVAFPCRVPSMRRQASMAPRTAMLFVFLAGASLVHVLHRARTGHPCRLRGLSRGTADPCAEQMKMGEVAVSGACISDEQAAFVDPQEVGEQGQYLRHLLLQHHFCQLQSRRVNDCVTSSIDMSLTCAKCHAATGAYG